MGLSSTTNGAGLELLTPGAQVWCPDPACAGGWVPGTVLRRLEASTALVLRLQTTEDEVEVEQAACFLQNQEEVEDMTTLSFLHEPGVLWNLQRRHKAGSIYTNTGSILIAVNPLSPILGLYGSAVVDQYHGRQFSESPPHVYAIACAAHRQMMRDGAGQAILITGESGAGKTEASKLVMQCLTQIGAQSAGEWARVGTANSGEPAPACSSGSIQEKVLESNPLLEAFGNAKTARNDNSSRFGKYVELLFAPRGTLAGAVVRTYLLERSRVVHVSPGERSFHAFYQLCAGASHDERQRWQLDGGAGAFAYLSQSSCRELPGVSDAQEYQRTRQAMAHVGLGQDVQEAIFATLAAILHLGNVDIVDKEHGQAAAGTANGNGDASEACLVAGAAAELHLTQAAALLGVPADALVITLTTRTRNTVEGRITSPLRAKAALENRDALARTLYARLFDWLVAQINSAMAASSTDAAGAALPMPQGLRLAVNGTIREPAGGAGLTTGSVESLNGTVAGSGDGEDGVGDGTPVPGGRCGVHCIGLLDIYGFESFAVNDLEQLCINLANEKLQQHFNQHVFKWEQAEYVREGIDWSLIEFEDNQDVVDLLEGRMGLVELLDEQCRFPTATAEDLSVKLSGAPVLQASGRFRPLKRPATAFAIEHYAGSVTYLPTNFLDKNRDYVVADHCNLMRASKSLLVQQLFAEPAAAEAEASSAGGANGNGPAAPPTRRPSPGAAPALRSAYQFNSVAMQFRRQLGGLMDKLGVLQPHYVRCIKPNAGGVPGQFDPGYALQQLKCGGVMEAVRISCAGFAYKRSYAAFLGYFWPVEPAVLPALHKHQRHPADRGGSGLAGEAAGGAAERELQEAARQLMQAGGVTDYQLGHTKVFMKAGQVAFLEAQRARARTAAAISIQAAWRGSAQRHWYHAACRAALAVQAHVRGHLARRRVHRIRVELAAVVLQSCWRAAVARRLLAHSLAAAVRMQAAWRARAARQQAAQLRLAHAAVTLQSAWRARAVCAAFALALRRHRAAVRIQCRWRAQAARRRFLDLLPQHRAAKVIQRTWRSCRDGTRRRDVLRAAFLLAWVRHKCATSIQRAWRGKAARLRLLHLRQQEKRQQFRLNIQLFDVPGSCGMPGLRTPSESLGRKGSCKPGSGRTCTQDVPSGEVVRTDALPHQDRDTRLRQRLGPAQEFKVGSLLDFWQGRAQDLPAAAAAAAAPGAGREPPTRRHTCSTDTGGNGEGGDGSAIGNEGGQEGF